MENDSITLELTNYICKGSVDVTFWDGEEGGLCMDSYAVAEPTDEAIIKGVNDGRFGVASINAAYVTVYKNYHGYQVLLEEREYSLEQLRSSKRGIVAE